MKKVMIIEDDLSAQSLLTTLLRFEGYEILLPQFGSEQIIIEDITRLLPDLILMDVHLRKVNGLVILKEIRANSELETMKVIVTSGEDYSYECRKNGADGFLMKPYMPDDLTQLINRLLLS
jgi:DNA-binding response OmpR family regulator